MFSGEISLRISLMTARRLAQNRPEGAGLFCFGKSKRLRFPVEKTADLRGLAVHGLPQGCGEQ